MFQKPINIMTYRQDDSVFHRDDEILTCYRHYPPKPDNDDGDWDDLQQTNWRY